MRYFIYSAYDGTNYHGWQIQPNGDSVQETLMRALSTFLRQEIEVVGKYIAHAGVASRRKAEELIKEGRVTLNGKTVTELATRCV